MLSAAGTARDCTTAGPPVSRLFASAPDGALNPSLLAKLNSDLPRQLDGDEVLVLDRTLDGPGLPSSPRRLDCVERDSRAVGFHFDEDAPDVVSAVADAVENGFSHGVTHHGSLRRSH